MSSRLHSATSLRQHEQQLVLGGREVDRNAVDQDTVLTPVDVDRTDREDVRWRGGRRSYSSQNRADTEHELLRAEWLREIVIGTEAEPPYAVWLFDAGRQHQHADVPGGLRGSELLEDLVSGQA